MFNFNNPERKMIQALRLASIQQERLSPADTLFTASGRRLYLIGDIDGQFRPRSNPYDLYAFGHPQPDDPLAGKLQGVWAQPVKGLSGYSYRVALSDRQVDLNAASRFTQTFSGVEFQFEDARFTAARRDFVPVDLPVLFSTLEITNPMSQTMAGSLLFRAEFDLVDAWFTHLAERRNAGQELSVVENHLIARAEVRPEDWAVAVGCEVTPDGVTLLPGSSAEMRFDFRVQPGATTRFTFAVVVMSEGGATAALDLLVDVLPRRAALWAEKETLYQNMLERGPRLISPDEGLNRAFWLAQANLQMLEARTDGLGSYFYAGLEMFPFWFSNDGAYSAPGLLAAGLVSATLNHVRIGARYQEAGRVPHQISPSGQTAFAGNAQETPLWVLSVWDAFCWTGQRDFLEEMYPTVQKGIFDYTLGMIDPDGDGYPSGAGMVEVEGMGEEKLDSAAYTWMALKALRQMALTLGDADAASRAQGWVERIEAHFEADWWDEPTGTYAMSLTADNRRYPVPHWAVVTPLEVGLASAQHAAQTFATLRKAYLNRWGLKHTAGEDERVWTLPTATLSRAAFRNGEPEMGFEMLTHVADTLSQGSIGMFHELIPEGACFIQLWSAAVFIRGVVEDLLGISVRADRHELTLAPRLPAGFGPVRLENFAFGEHVVNIAFENNGQVRVEEVRGGPVAVIHSNSH